MSKPLPLQIGPELFGIYNWYTPIAGLDPNGRPQILQVGATATATATLTSSGVNVTENDTVTVGRITYRFKATPAQAYDVDIGDSAAATLDNLKAAVNIEGTPGTDYHSATVQNPDASATTNTDTTQLFVARVAGPWGNNLPFSKSAATYTVSGATFSGGLNGGIQISPSGGSLATNRTAASAATLANVAYSASNVTLAAANANRKGLLVHNDTDKICYIKFGATASTTSFTKKLAAGADWAFPEPMYLGIVDIIWEAAGTGAARVTELT